MDINKFLEMKPMKYVGGTSAKKRVERFLSGDSEYQDWLYSYKVDGEWCRIVYSLDGEVTIQGRGISKATKKQKDNTQSLPHLVEYVKRYWPRGTVAIGELSFEDFENTTQTQVGSILRSLPARAIKNQEGNPLYFYPFDMLAFDGKDLSDEVFEVRIENIEMLREIVGIDEDKNYVRPLLHFRVSNGALEYLDKVLSRGGEGIVIMNPKGKYLPNSRSVYSSLKIKKELGEMTLKVIGLVDPLKQYRGDNPEFWEYRDEEGNPVTKYYSLGWKNGIIVDYKGNSVKITSGISDEDAEWLASEAAAAMIENGELYADVTAMSESNTINESAASLRHPTIIKIRTDL